MNGDLRQLALWCTALIWLGCISAYLASATQEYVPWCIPHLSGCDSVSATGRHGWGYFLFKACLLPAAGLLWCYWLLCDHWLGLLGARGRLRRSILVLGWLATGALVLYVTFLGSDGDVYRLLRRYGTVVFFGGTYLAELLLIQQLRRLSFDPPYVTALTWVAALMFVGGASFGIAANLLPFEDELQNVSEWNFGTALTAFPALTWLGWRRSGFRTRTELERP